LIGTAPRHQPGTPWDPRAGFALRTMVASAGFVAQLTTHEMEETYNVTGWADGYFRVTPRGTLAVTPLGPDGPAADLLEVVESLEEQGFGTPLLIRFPQILEHRVDRLNRAFQKALKVNNCKGVRYRGVFPIKVNQRREVVQVLTAAGRKWSYGLEVGSKAELVAALTMDPNPKSLLVVNGFKDRPFMEAACQATHFKEDVIVVLDEVGELDHMLPLMDAAAKRPLLGVRLKLRSKAPGKWAMSGGERAKFGLTIPEVLHVVERLRKTGHLDRLQMLHFHIGSQIGDIRRMVRGVREAARMHAELVRLGVPLSLVDVGGGLAVDYDGSGSSSPNSANYTMEEYASSVVATIKDVCDDAGVAMPDIISESGRAVVSHHALLAVQVLRRVPSIELPPDENGPTETDPTPLWNLYEALQHLNAKNVYETFHDVVQWREDLQDLFDLGHLSVEALGRGDRVFRAIIAQVRSMLAASDETDSEEYQGAAAILSQKLVCNFSLFQSLPDVWGVKQQFPILPLHRLREAPNEMATLADITCDSDGEIRRFIDLSGTKPDLPVHKLRPGEPYYLAMALVGAYQDTLGDYHNLFGETNEAFIEVQADGTWTCKRSAHGSRVSDMLSWVRYNPQELKRRIRSRVQRLKDSGKVDAETARELSARFIGLVDSSTYLDLRSR
jgi:arginine decarboxylase